MFKQVINHIVRHQPGSFRLEIQTQTMSQYRVRYRVDVLVLNGITSIEQCMRLGTEHQVLTRTGTCSPADIFPHQVRRLFTVRPAGPDQTKSVTGDVIRDWKLPDKLSNFTDTFRIHHRLDIDLLVIRRLLDNRQFLLAVRVIDLDMEHETIELGLGKRVGPFLFDRVLGR